MKILTVANEKGGVGKTLLSVQFAFYCAFKFGLKVAVLDLDQQANTTIAISANENCSVAELTSSSFMLETEEQFPQKLRSQMNSLESSSLVCFPADDVLSEIEKKGEEFHYVAAYNFNANVQCLAAYFDLVVIDTNPNPDVRSNIGIAVATH